ncbi:MAG: aspartyl protease family protein [Caulobacteraceae bacterium]|nr:aspartyl protease family protein [Caulobacteraceae bacterium]
MATLTDARALLSTWRIALLSAALCVGAPGGAANAAAPPDDVGARFQDGLIFVDAEVNGSPGVFVLDTGAAATVLTPGFAQASGLRLGRRRRIDATGGDVGARQAEVVELSLAGGSSARIAPLVADLSGISRAMGVPIAGVLGEDVLRSFVVTLDYRDRRVALARSVQDPPDATPIRFGATPYVEARAVLGDRIADGEFEIDTGSNTAVVFWRPFARAKFGDAPARRDVGVGAGGRLAVESGSIDALEVAGRRIAPLAVNFADTSAPPDDAGPRYGGLIGGPAWEGLILTLDLPGRRMWVR